LLRRAAGLAPIHRFRTVDGGPGHATQTFSIRIGPMNVLFKALLTGISEVAEGRGLKRYRISHKRNANGQL